MIVKEVVKDKLSIKISLNFLSNIIYFENKYIRVYVKVVKNNMSLIVVNLFLILNCSVNERKIKNNELS